MILIILAVIAIVICSGTSGSGCDNAMMWYWFGYWDRDRRDPYF